MYVELVVGEVADASGLRRQWEEWATHLGPGAAGWLGSVAGITGKGELVHVARFASEADARASARRPEQAEWWGKTEACLARPAEQVVGDDVTEHGGGLAGDAGFVQVMRARCRDRARFEAVEEEIAGAFMALRPDMLGAARLWGRDGSMAAIDRFTSEAEARAGEQLEMPEGLREGFGEWMSLLDDVRWYDLTDPWLAAPPQ